MPAVMHIDKCELCYSIETHVWAPTWHGHIFSVYEILLRPHVYVITGILRENDFYWQLFNKIVSNDSILINTAAIMLPFGDVEPI